MNSRKHRLRIHIQPEGVLEAAFSNWINQWPSCCLDFSLQTNPTLRPLGTDIGRSAKLSFHGRARGDLFLMLRGPHLVDDSSNDDWIDLELTPKFVDYKCLVRNWIPSAVRAFNPYLVELAPEQTLVDDFGARMQRQESNNKRSRALEFQPATYISNKLCRNSFNQDPQVLCSKIGHICNATPIGDGLYIHMTDTELTHSEIEGFRTRLKHGVADYN